VSSYNYFVSTYNFLFMLHQLIHFRCDRLCKTTMSTSRILIVFILGKYELNEWNISIWKSISQVGCPSEHHVNSITFLDQKSVCIIVLVKITFNWENCCAYVCIDNIIESLVVILSCWSSIDNWLKIRWKWSKNSCPIPAII